MSDAHQPVFRRAVVALNGGPSDARIVRLVAELARPHKAELIAVHVVEIDWTLPLDADIAGRSEEVQRVLDMAEEVAEDIEVPARAGPAPGPRRRRRHRRRGHRARRRPARRGPAYRKRFGGEFAIGRTIPYILQNAPCAVWVVRDPIRGVNVKIVIVGCGRVGASVAEALDRGRPPGHHPRHRDLGVRPAAGDVRGRRHPRRRHRRGRPAPGRRRGRRRLPGPDRGRQPQRHGRPARDRGARRRAGRSPRSTIRSGPRRMPSSGIATLCRTGPDVGRRRSLPRAARRPACPGMLAPTGHHHGDRQHDARPTAASAGLRRPAPSCDRRAGRRPRRAEPCSCSSSAAARSATTWPRSSSSRAMRSSLMEKDPRAREPDRRRDRLDRHRP